MNKVFLVSLALGVVQVVLLRFLLYFITVRKNLLAVLLFFIKFGLYGFAIWKFMFHYFKYASFCAFGFGIGMILTSFLVFIYSAFIKKDDEE